MHKNPQAISDEAEAQGFRRIAPELSLRIRLRLSLGLSVQSGGRGGSNTSMQN
jgi:hypothetical protein